MEETLTSGYLEMLGTLSKQKDGIESVLIVYFSYTRIEITISP